VLELSFSIYSRSWSFSLRHLGQLSRNSIKTRHNSIRKPTFRRLWPNNWLNFFGHLKTIRSMAETNRQSQSILCQKPGLNERGTISPAPNHYEGAELQRESAWWLKRAPKSPDNVTSTFFNKLHLLQKNLRLKHGGAKISSCPGPHLNSWDALQLSPC